jgi:sec-independent protein translocase protein TatA
MFRSIGAPEIILILAVLLLLFGAKRLPEIGRSVGKSLREFKGATKGLADDVKSGLEDDEDAEDAAPQASTPMAKGRAKDAAE